MPQSTLPHKGGLECMMKGVLMVVVGVLLGCTTTSGVKEPWTMAKASTVLVDDLSGGIGTGVVVNNQCVVTAGHVANMDALVITTDKGDVYQVRRVAHDDEEDVAAVCASGPIDAPPVSFGAAPAPY